MEPYFTDETNPPNEYTTHKIHIAKQTKHNERKKDRGAPNVTETTPGLAIVIDDL